MKQPLLKDSDLPRILEMLERASFGKVAGYFGCTLYSIKCFLGRHGIDARKYNRKSGSKGKDWAYVMPTGNAPQVIREYPWHGHIVKVYEARYARI